MSRWGGSKVRHLRAQVIAHYGDVCWLCGAPIAGTVTVDHVVPRSLGGSDELDNLRPACMSCNSSRGNGTRRRAPATSRAW